MVEIANIHAVFVHVTENMVGCGKDQSEYPTNLTQATGPCVLKRIWPAIRRRFSIFLHNDL